MTCFCVSSWPIPVDLFLSIWMVLSNVFITFNKMILINEEELIWHLWRGRNLKLDLVPELSISLS